MFSNENTFLLADDQTYTHTLHPDKVAQLQRICTEFAQSLHTESADLRCARRLIINQLMRPRCSLLTYLTTTCPSQSVINIRSCCRHRQNYQHRRQPGSTECSKTWLNQMAHTKLFLAVHDSSIGDLVSE